MDFKGKAITAVLAVTLAGFISFGGGAALAAGPVCTVPEDYTTIQGAVDDADCTTVNVAANTYTEQVVVNRNLTLTGAGSATTIIQAPVLLNSDPDGAKTLVLFTGPITAEFSGFTVQGPVNGLNFGIYVRDGATANIHDNVIKDIRDEPLSGNQYGYAIEVGKYNNTFPNVDQIGHATITDNTIYGYQKTGIECEGTGSSATITGNTVTGAGLIPTTAQNGIQIRRGATGSITNNVVTGNAYTGHEVNATGIAVTYPGDDVIIQGNIVNHNTANIYTYEADGVQILNNQVSDAADGRITAGITADADNVATASVGITVTISGNSVKNNLSGGSHQGPGIFLWGIKSGIVSGNDIVGSGDDGILIGASGNITITNNLFSGNGYDPYPGGNNPPYSSIVGPDPNAAAIDFGGVIPELELFGVQPNPLGGFSVHNNSFLDNLRGIWNYDSASVDATNNWWGQNTGPASGQTGGPVDTCPWIYSFTDDPLKEGENGFWPNPFTLSNSLNTAVSPVGSGTLLCNGQPCAGSYACGTTVDITATANACGVFTNWSGNCSGPGGCSVTTGSGPISVTANFTTGSPYTLSVKLFGNGKVTADPPDAFTCPLPICSGTVCTGTYCSGTQVTLTAVPDNGYKFSGWSGACSGKGTCTVTMMKSKSVTASFTQLPTKKLSVSLSGNGKGTISADPLDKFTCGKSSCSGSYPLGTVVTLTETPNGSSDFAGWSGACLSAGTNPTCVVTVTKDLSAGAKFSKKVYNLAVTVEGTKGSVTASPPPNGLWSAKCNSGPCNWPYYASTNVKLTASASHGYKFVGWTGACTGGSSHCTVTMDSAEEVTATFAPK